MSFEDSFGWNKAWYYVKPELDSKFFDILMVFLKELLKKVKTEIQQKSADNKKECKITQYAKSQWEKGYNTYSGIWSTITIKEDCCFNINVF